MLAHSLLGCAVYGAFAAKVTILRLHRFPKLVLPVAGGLLFATLIAVWYTSALWLYRQPAVKATSPGAAVFQSAGCGTCHTLAAAGTHGSLGPNLDQARPSAAAVRAQVLNGGGGMPPFRGRLTPAQIREVAGFVAASAGR